MKPLKLKLQGFSGIRAGLGRDELELDFRPFDGAQLVALVGPNGTGKTTVLDSMTPFRVMPARAGDALGNFSFYEHLCLPEAGKPAAGWGGAGGGGGGGSRDTTTFLQRTENLTACLRRWSLSKVTKDILGALPRPPPLTPPHKGEGNAPSAEQLSCVEPNGLRSEG